MNRKIKINNYATSFYTTRKPYFIIGDNYNYTKLFVDNREERFRFLIAQKISNIEKKKHKQSCRLPLNKNNLNLQTYKSSVLFLKNDTLENESELATFIENDKSKAQIYTFITPIAILKVRCRLLKSIIKKPIFLSNNNDFIKNFSNFICSKTSLKIGRVLIKSLKIWHKNVIEYFTNFLSIIYRENQSQIFDFSFKSCTLAFFSCVIYPLWKKPIIFIDKNEIIFESTIVLSLITQILNRFRLFEKFFHHISLAVKAKFGSTFFIKKRLKAFPLNLERLFKILMLIKMAVKSKLFSKAHGFLYQTIASSKKISIGKLIHTSNGNYVVKRLLSKLSAFIVKNPYFNYEQINYCYPNMLKIKNLNNLQKIYKTKVINLDQIPKKADHFYNKNISLILNYLIEGKCWSHKIYNTFLNPSKFTEGLVHYKLENLRKLLNIAMNTYLHHLFSFPFRPDKKRAIAIILSEGIKNKDIVLMPLLAQIITRIRIKSTKSNSPSNIKFYRKYLCDNGFKQFILIQNTCWRKFKNKRENYIFQPSRFYMNTNQKYLKQDGIYEETIEKLFSKKNLRLAHNAVANKIFQSSQGILFMKQFGKRFILKLNTKLHLSRRRGEFLDQMVNKNLNVIKTFYFDDLFDLAQNVWYWDLNLIIINLARSHFMGPNFSLITKKLWDLIIQHLITNLLNFNISLQSQLSLVQEFFDSISNLVHIFMVYKRIYLNTGSIYLPLSHLLLRLCQIAKATWPEDLANKVTTCLKPFRLETIKKIYRLLMTICNKDSNLTLRTIETLTKLSEQ
jgi:hypothetical protein